MNKKVRRRLTMAKLKGKGVVMAGLLAGAASFLSKKENRDKAMDFINGAKMKTTDGMNEDKNMEVANEIGVIADIAEAAANPLQVDENKFISEGGAQKTIESIIRMMIRMINHLKQPSIVYSF